MLTDQQVSLLMEELATAKNPLFLFDDDPDGLCSFLLLYKINKEGHGTVVKTLPKITTLFLRKVKEYTPDKIFILDMPLVEQEFINQVKVPVFWLDHHAPQENYSVNYFNPRVQNPDAYFPTTYLTYQVSSSPEDLWIALVGCLGDYHFPDFLPDFLKKYPDLLKKEATLEQAIYQEPIGQLVRVLAFLLKGKTSEVNKCIRILTKIKSPYEILKQQTSQGKYLYKRFDQVNQKYLSLLKTAKKVKTREKLLTFIYTDQSWSFTSELSSELLHLHPHNIILVARKKSGEMKGSLRSKKFFLPPALEKALIGIEGYGGGHEHACGFNIKEYDWPQFLANLKREIK